MIGLEKIIEKYGYTQGYFRTLLCRPEFNQFRLPTNSFFVFDDSDNFHKMLKFIINLKTKKYIILLFLLLNTQIAFCQRYEPVIIYNQYGEPQSMIKSKIIKNIKYTSYGGYKK